MPLIQAAYDSEDIRRILDSNSLPLVLGLDLGTRCGYAFALREKDGWHLRPLQMGQLDLHAGPYDSGAIRFIRLRRYLAEFTPCAIFYEDVKFTPTMGDQVSAAKMMARTSTASELIGSFKSTVCTWAEELDIPCQGYAISSIKKFAVGKGSVNKEGMIQACNTRYGTDFGIEDYKSTGVDNVADAAFVLHLGITEYGKGISNIGTTEVKTGG